VDEKYKQKFDWKKLKGIDHAEEPDVNGRIILECILKRYAGSVWTGFNWLRLGNNGEFL